MFNVSLTTKGPLCCSPSQGDSDLLHSLYITVFGLFSHTVLILLQTTNMTVTLKEHINVDKENEACVSHVLHVHWFDKQDRPTHCICDNSLIYSMTVDDWACEATSRS